MTAHFLFDTETLGKSERAIIAALSVVMFRLDDNLKFDDYMNPRSSIYVKFKIPEQVSIYHRVTDKPTTDWWHKQSDEAKRLSIRPSVIDTDFKEGFTQVMQFLKDSGYTKDSYLWSRGSSFDFPKIENALDSLEISGLNTWKIRDTRTYIDILAGVDNGMYSLLNPLPQTFIPHHCHHDAIKEVLIMTELFRLAMK